MQNNDLSNAERHLWETVQKNPQKIAKMSIVELSQFAHWFKYLLYSIDYEWIDEVQFIQYRDKFNEEDAVYSSEDL